MDEAIYAFEIAASNNYFNWYCMQHIVTLSRLLDREDLTPRVARLWDDAVKRFGKSEEPKGGLGATDPIEKSLRFVKQYPKDSLPYHVKLIRNEPHITLCLDAQYDEALKHAANDLALEDIAATQIVLGDFVTAQETLKRITTRNSVKDMLIVFIIEKFRRNEMKDVFSLLDELRARQIDLWEYVHLAFGFAGYEPWGGYPYADY
ncbi:MAG: hypothetical protein H7Y59_17545 [Anaerolineales bacterium]|nr:hypothetical protein [Anaerolineales bacterium]